MPAASAAHKHRHYKTLILLVVSMTVGAFFLFWLGQMAPVTPLRGKAAVSDKWGRVVVRTAASTQADAGFFHYRIDEAGQLYQTAAWKNSMHDPRHADAIQIVVSLPSGDAGISRTQEKSLARLVSELRRKFSIPADQIRLAPEATLASAG